MLIWEGKGWVVAVIVFVSSYTANLITNEVTGSDKYWNDRIWPLGIALCGAGFLCWMFGRSLGAMQGRRLIDVDTGEYLEIEEPHTLFWVPVKHWSGIVAVLGVLAIVGDLLQVQKAL